MSFARTVLFSALVLTCALWCSTVSWADGVLLKNGSRIDGTVIDERDTTGKVVVQIGEMGRLWIRGADVEAIERDGDAPAPAAPVPAAASDRPAAGELVEVRLPGGTDKNGAGVYYGILSPRSTQDTIVLEIPGSGTITLNGAAGCTVTASDATIAGVSGPAEDATPTTIETTHIVHLKNGRQIRGNVVATPEDAPIKVRIGSMGEMSIPRADLGEKGIEEAAGTIEVSPEPEPVEAPAEATEWTAEDVEQLKQEIRAELLREILDGLIDQKLENKVEKLQDIEERIPGAPYVQLPPERIDEIQFHLRELTRQRHQNRVRAEGYLKDMGPDVLPFLDALAYHPFDLTRRAVQRIVKEIGDVRGAPISIGALNDADAWVRKLAHESLEALLPGASIRYSAQAAESHRLAARERYYQYWDEEMRLRIREALLANANIDS